jgi:hypothetical protein
MLGMPDMSEMQGEPAQPNNQPQPKKKKKFGLGDLLQGAVPHP